MPVSASDNRPHVLAIDDDSLILRYLHIALERAGYRPATLEDPLAVIEEIKGDPPDLILLDIRLPETDGFTLFAEIRSVSPSPVIFLSASNRAEDRNRALGLGASAFVVKPFSPAELMRTVEDVLSKYQGDSEGNGHTDGKAQA
ncbi:MAG: response regulator [Dehalococcoidia bacterium]